MLRTSFVEVGVEDGMFRRVEGRIVGHLVRKGGMVHRVEDLIDGRNLVGRPVHQRVDLATRPGEEVNRLVKPAVVLRAGEVHQRAVQEVVVRSPRWVVADLVGEAKRLNHLVEEYPLIGLCRRSLQPNREASLLSLKEQSQRVRPGRSSLLHLP